MISRVALLGRPDFTVAIDAGSDPPAYQLD